MSESASPTPDGAAGASPPEPFATSLQRFLTDLAQQRRLSSHTREAYRRDLLKYGRVLAGLGHRALDRVTPADVSRALAQFEASGLSPATVARSASAIRRFHSYLLDAGLSDRDPAAGLRAPRIDRRPPQVLALEEVEQVMAAAAGPEPLARRDRAMLELLYAAGLKVSELTALEEEQVMTEAALVRVVGRGARDRLVPLGRQAVAALEAYRRHGRPPLAGPDSGPVFFLNARGTRLSRMSVWKIIRAAARRAGLERPVSPHLLRHTFAAHLLEGGADLRDVQLLLGHADISTTQVYARVDEAHLRRVHQTYHPRGS